MVLLLLSVPLKSQDIGVISKLDTNRIYIGDQVWFTITVKQPESLVLNLQSFKDTLISKIDIVAGPVSDTTTISTGLITIRNRYLITSFDSGYYNIPPVYAEISDTEGVRRFYSDYNQLEVMRVRLAPADTSQKIYDIILPYKAPLTLDEVLTTAANTLPWLLIGAVLILASFLLIRAIKKMKKKEGDIIFPEKTDPAHIIAFRELEKLKADELWQKGDYKLYCTRLTEILRTYLENRFGVNSLEMTTSETLNAFLKSGMKKDENYALLKSVLSLSDMVKFAKYVPASGENETLYNGSWEFVEKTRMPDEMPSAQTEKGEEVKS